MKKLLFAIILSGLFLITTQTVHGQLAASCGSFIVSPESGPVGTTFTYSATGCPESGYFIRVHGISPARPARDLVGINLVGGTFERTDVVPEPGTYFAALVLNGLQVNTLSITVGGQAEVECGDFVVPGFPDCPAECPAETITTDPNAFQQAICGGLPAEARPTRTLASECPDGKGTGINTAIGCIPVLTDDPNDFLGFILTWAIGLGGGIAFLLIVFAGFQIMTSTGNPDKLKGGQQLLTSAIAGLILLIFSVFVLRVVGVDILKIPGLGR